MDGRQVGLKTLDKLTRTSDKVCIYMRVKVIKLFPTLGNETVIHVPALVSLTGCFYGPLLVASNIQISISLNYSHATD